MLLTSFLFSIRIGGVLPNQYPVHDDNCLKHTFSFILARGVCYPTKLQRMTSNVANAFYHSHWKDKSLSYPTNIMCMITNVANVLSHSHWQGVSITQPNFSAWLQTYETSFVIPICKGGVLHIQSPENDSDCTKRLFSFQIVSGQSYPTNIFCITWNVTSVFPHSH